MGADTFPVADRIVTLDIVRGVAVMGILTMNIVAFAMPYAAYVNPNVYGTESISDLVSWAVNFILFDGRMRGLFSFLFGASLLLVIDRAEASGRSAARVHYARMGWLLAFGVAHFVLVWWGDILTLYALLGMIAFAFRRCRVSTLINWALGILLVQFVLFVVFSGMLYAGQAAATAPGASAKAIAQWDELRAGLENPAPADIADEIALMLGSYGELVAVRAAELGLVVSENIAIFGWETLAYFLLGMASLRSGFLTGAWSDKAYRRIAVAGFGIGIPIHTIFAWALIKADHDVPIMFLLQFTATIPVRVLMIGATAALIILAARNGGALVDRIAAAGRMAFTNYLATSILMTALFEGWGIGRFGSLSRAELWLPVLAMWALMLLWSKPWLERFRYGPFEWLWRSLSRGRIEPLRRTA